MFLKRYNSYLQFHVFLAQILQKFAQILQKFSLFIPNDRT